VIPGGGATVTIQGTPAATDSFSLQPSSSQSIFKTLANLVGALEGTVVTPADQAKYASDLNSALVNLGQATDNIIAVRAQVGSRLSELDSLANLNQDLNLQYAQTLSNLQDIDYAKATADLTRKQTDLQAAQQSFTRISQLSLFNYL
jgi:flagellar hook-associated protein 3 FlgL